MIGLLLPLLLLSAAPVAPSKTADCMGTLVHFGDGTSRVLVSFWVAGTDEQLTKISTEASKIGAIVEKPKEVEGRLVLLVFFESTVDGFQAFKLTNEVFAGVYHPGLAKEAIKKDVMFLPSSTLKNCKN